MTFMNFYFDNLARITFDSYFNKYEDLFRIDLMRLNHATKVKIFRTIEHEHYSNLILSNSPREFTFDEAIKRSL